MGGLLANASPHTSRVAKGPRRGLGGLAALLALVCVSAAGVFAFGYLPRQRSAEIAAWSRDLSVRADLRYEALTRFFEDGVSGARTIAGYPTSLAALESDGTAAARAHVGPLLENFGRSEGFFAASLFDRDAQPAVLSAKLQPDAGCRAAARAVLSTGMPGIGLHLHEGLGALLTFTAPVTSADGRIQGVAIVFSNPTQWLYPFLAQPLAGTDTGDAALVAREGNDAVLLSPLRDRPDAPLKFRKPLGMLGLGTRAAFEGRPEVQTLTDYRGRRVLATGRLIPPSPWALVMRMDEAEALEAFRDNARRAALALGAFICAACALVWGLVQRRERLQHSALASSEARLAALLDEADDAIFVLDPDGRILDANRRAEDMYGLARADLLSRNTADLREPSERAQAVEAIARLNRDGRNSVVATHRRQDGSTFPAEIRSRRVELGASVFLVALVRDVTERRQHEDAMRLGEETLLETQRQLAQAQKMEAVGRLAGGIAHDFNNLLTVIRGYAELLASDLAGDDAKREEVAEILQAAERATGLTRQLLAFSRRQTFETQPLDLGAVISDTERMLKRLIGEDVHLTVERPERLGAVRADRGQVEQVLLNLAVNARDAMPRGGPLRIALAETTVETPLPSADGAVPPGRYVVLTVADAGCGMTPEILEHAFEPFFTTKETGKGTGLGLSTVFGIVKQSGGHIRVTSAPESGTHFDLYFPRVDDTDAAPAKPGPDGRGGSETILVAEDESAVRGLAVRLLAAHGYRVLSASGGEDALTQAGAAGALDLLLTDLVMPGMSGAELARRLSERRPGLRVLFMSGYPHDVLERFGVAGAEVPLLRKPFTAADLTRRVREALEGPEPAGLAVPGPVPPA